MSLDLARIAEELKGAPLSSPYARELAVAIICDAFRAGSAKPPSVAEIDAMMQLDPKSWEQLGMLAHVLRMTSVRLERPRVTDAAKALRQFFEEIVPLTGEMIRSNAFRQEEFLRKWANVIGTGIKGETLQQSAERREALDYRKTTAEYARAEAARKEEAKKREEALREAERRAAEARGWRE